MLPALTQLPPAVRTESSEQVQYEDNRSSAYNLSFNGSVGSWGKRTTGFGPVEEARKQQGQPVTTRGIIAVPGSIANEKLFAAWYEKSSSLLNDWDSDSVSGLVRISERYLLALKGSADHRIFISSFLNVFRFHSDIDQEGVQKISKIVDGYKGAHLSRDLTTSFVRQLRTAGYSPSSLGQINVEQG